MLNYKCKSHRGRSPANRTDSSTIIELENHITRAFAVVIPDKTAARLVDIIHNQVVEGSKIWTDEFPSYRRLRDEGFDWDAVCHKYCFVNSITGVNTQAVESFHNLIKGEIKKRRGIRTNLRQQFLNEFVFLWNNRFNVIEEVLNLIKIE